MTMEAKTHSIDISALQRQNQSLRLEDETIALTAKQDVSISSNEAALMLTAKTEANLLSEDIATMEGKSKLNLQGDKITGKGGSKIKMDSPDTDVL